MIRRALAVLPLLLALTGVGLAIVLVREHMAVVDGGLAEGLLCGGAGRYDCSAVAAHESSWVLGVPLALWGLLFYVAMTAIAIASFALDARGRRAACRLGLALAGAAVVFDAYLAWTMVTRIGAVCLNCVATYGVNVLLALAFALRWRHEQRASEAAAASPDAAAPARSPAWALPAIVLFAIAGMAGAAYASWRPIAMIREFAAEEAQEFLDQLRSPPAIEMSRFAGQPSRGPADAPVQIAVMSDFQCNFCRALSHHLERLQRRHPGAIRVLFVNAPVSSKCHPLIDHDVHEDACWLAEVGECAGAAGKFWEYHDFLYGEIPHPQVRLSAVAARIGEIGLDPAAIQACLDQGTGAAALARDTTLLRELKLDSVPALVINGHVERGGIYPDALSAIVRALLANR